MDSDQAFRALRMFVAVAEQTVRELTAAAEMPADLIAKIESSRDAARDALLAQRPA